MLCYLKTISMSADPTHRPKEKESRKIETVVIDDNENNNSNRGEEVVEILSDDEEVQVCKDTSLLEEILTNGGLFADVIEKCLDLDNSDGMEIIVKKTLMQYYRMVNKSFLESSNFNKNLLKTLRLLDSDPQHKFTHIKNLCEVLKSSCRFKKRVNLITLGTNLKDKSENPRKKKIANKIGGERKKRKVDVIEIDDKDSDEMDVIYLEEDKSESNHNIIESEKENEAINNFQDHIQNTLLTPQKEIPYTQNRNIPTTPSSNDDNISVLEKKIAYLHKKIKLYEEQEVIADSAMRSPYVICEKLKTLLVEHYKTLCKLTGSVDRKPKRIKLNVTAGHPPGPTKILEKFVNERMGGERFNFPDMMDVITCVEEGLKVDAVEWTRTQIVKEAITLFIRCGRALQKSRQRRDWKDLLYHVKEEQTWQDDDPAEHDPELMAKLELNRMIAERKESDLIKKYVELQDLPARARVMPSSSNQTLQTDKAIMNENTNNKNCVPTISVKTNINYTDGNTKELNLSSNQLAVDSSRIQIKNCKGYLEISVENMPDTQSVGQSSDCEGTIKIENNHNEYQEMTETITPNENEHTFIENSCIKTGEEENTTIKTEPTEKIAKLLESLGDSYTVSVVDIEDPFLIIEISSDSDSDD